jgi:hypothetical protein
MQYLFDRLKERSTWLGLIALATSFGVAVSPEQAEAIAVAGTSFAGLIAVFTRG